MQTCRICLIDKSLNDYQFRNDSQKYRTDCKKCEQYRINLYKRENTEYKKRYNEYQRNRRKKDINYLIEGRLRARINKMLTAQDASKYFTTFTLLGCTMEIFKQYLEKKFYGDMNFEKRNFVLDHIVPCSWFDLSNPIHQKICFNYKNIQPLTAADNSKKSDKIWLEYNIMKNPYI
jgi:hypothetical protein